MTRTSHWIALMTVPTILVAAELPITRVVVYKNGVAYFERSGTVKPGDTARLDFRASEMDDVLKSLVVEDRGGGAVTRLRYELSEPVQRKLAELPSIPPGASLAQLLDVLRGSRVELSYNNTAVTGRIVSGRVSTGKDQEQKQELTLLLSNGELLVADLSLAKGLKLLETEAQTQLTETLDVLARTRSREKRTVTIEGGSGQRQILARYLVPAPVWKSTYRLLLPDSGDATLEGWALVDNASGEDWNNVDLTVVSGRPVSFISRLYEPRFVTRQVATLAEEQAAAPIVHEGAIMSDAVAAQMMPKAMPAPGMGGGVGRGSGRERAVAAAPPVQMMEMQPSNVAETAVAREAGDLFEYRFPSPVSARKGESAMIPFLQQKITSRRLLLYSNQTGLNPRAAIELTNSSGKTLDGGPITVFQSGSYGGEALMDTTKAGDKRLISYAVDLGTRVTTNFESGTETVREIKANRGVITVRAAVERTTTYTATNVDERAKTLVIEHPVDPDSKLIKPKADETTPQHHRFNVALTAKGSQKLVVVEENEIFNSIAATDVTADFLLQYTQNRNLSAAARKQMETIIARKRDLQSVTQQITNAEAETNEITRDQARLRQNMESLNRVSGQQDQVQRYAAELARQDTSLAQLRDRLSELRKRRDALNSEVQALIEKLEF